MEIIRLVLAATAVFMNNYVIRREIKLPVSGEVLIAGTSVLTGLLLVLIYFFTTPLNVYLELRIDRRKIIQGDIHSLNRENIPENYRNIFESQTTILDYELFQGTPQTDAFLLASFFYVLWFMIMNVLGFVPYLKQNCKYMAFILIALLVYEIKALFYKTPVHFLEFLPFTIQDQVQVLRNVFIGIFIYAISLDMMENAMVKRREKLRWNRIVQEEPIVNFISDKVNPNAQENKEPAFRHLLTTIFTAKITKEITEQAQNSQSFVKNLAKFIFIGVFIFWVNSR